MNFRQKLAILFYLVRSKKSTDGKIPIYVRITIDGLSEEFSSRCKVFDQDWDAKIKQVLPTDKDHKQINKTLNQIKTDLERHFDLVQAKDGLATPVLVLESYRTPLNGKRLHDDKVENLAFSTALDDLIDKYLKFNKKAKKATKYGKKPSPEMAILLSAEKELIEGEIAGLVKQGNAIFDKKSHIKTLILAVDEYLLNFLELVLIDERSANSLEKLIGRKKRYLEFIQYRYKKQDLPLETLEYQFIEDFNGYLIKQYRLKDISASKYAQSIKEIIDRVTAKGWISHNIFSIFQCTFKREKKKRPKADEFTILENYEFEDENLDLIRDLFLFGCYTGYAYQEIHNSAPENIKKGNDGELWIYIDRQKTGNEEGVPLLPPALALIEKYKDHPIAVRRNRLFPVPSNQAYNRGLKVIAELLKFQYLKLKSHDARRYFANEMTFKRGIELKVVSGMLGHKTVKTTELYIDVDEDVISQSMKKVREQLINEEKESKSSTQVVEITNPLKVVHISGK